MIWRKVNDQNMPGQNFLCTVTMLHDAIRLLPQLLCMRDHTSSLFNHEEPTILQKLTALSESHIIFRHMVIHYPVRIPVFHSHISEILHFHCLLASCSGLLFNRMIFYVPKSLLKCPLIQDDTLPFMFNLRILFSVATNVAYLKRINSLQKFDICLNIQIFA